MKIKLFVFASITYMIVLGAFIFTINAENYTLELGSYSLTLPIVIWFLLPVFVLFVVALVHMSFYGLLRYLKYKHFFDDADKFEALACEVLLQKPNRTTFKTQEFKNAAELCKSVKTRKKIPNFAKFNEAIELLNELDEGKSVNLRKFKLDEDNALCVQNENNRIKNDLNYAFSRIKGKKEFEDESDLLAFETLLQNGDMAQIQSVKLTKDASQRLGLIERFEKGTLQMSGAEFESLLNAGGFDEKDFLSAAKMSVKKLNPDALIAVFKRLKNTYPEALRAYLYILAEFSLFDELRLEIGNDKTHFNDFKIVLLAREKNQKVDLNKLIC